MGQFVTDYRHCGILAVYINEDCASFLIERSLGTAVLVNNGTCFKENYLVAERLLNQFLYLCLFFIGFNHIGVCLGELGQVSLQDRVLIDEVLNDIFRLLLHGLLFFGLLFESSVILNYERSMDL